MAPLLTDIMDALAAQLEEQLIAPADVDLHIEPRAFAIAETPAIDMFIANPTGLEASLAAFADLYGGIPITIRARVSTADVIAGEDLLLALMDQTGDLSIVAALDSDHTLDGKISDLSWGDGSFPWTGYQDFPMSDGNGILLGSTLTVVVVPGSGS